MNPNQQFNNYNMTPEQFNLLQQRLLQQQQQQGMLTAGMPGMPGAGGGLNVIGNASAGMASNNNNDWRNGQHEGLRREMLLMLMNTLRQSAGQSAPLEKIQIAVANAEKTHWESAVSLEEYKAKVVSQCNSVKNQINHAMRQQQMQQQNQRQGQVQGSLLNMGMNQMRPQHQQQQNIGMNQANSNNNNANIPNGFNMSNNQNQQQQILMAQQMMQQQLQHLRPPNTAVGNMTMQQQQQHLRLNILEGDFTRLRTGIIRDPAVEAKFMQYMTTMNAKRVKSEQVSIIDADKKLIKDLSVTFFKNVLNSYDFALYLVFSSNSADPKLEPALKNKWLMMDQVSNTDKDIFFMNKEIAGKLMVDLKAISSQAALIHPIYSNMSGGGGGGSNSASPFATGGPKTPSARGDGSGAGTPEKTTLSSSFPLQPAIKKEDVQEILKRDFGQRPVSEFEYSEIVALERSLYPGFALKASEVGHSFAGGADIAELDATYLFGDSKLIDPNQSTASSSSFTSRWSSVLSQKELIASIPAFEEEVRLAAAAHQVIHNMQFLLNEEVSILFYDGADDSSNNSSSSSKKVLGLSIPNLAKYQQVQASLLAGNGVQSNSGSGSSSIVAIDLLDGFDTSLTDMLHSLLKQGANIKTCLELLWPAV